MKIINIGVRPITLILFIGYLFCGCEKDNMNDLSKSEMDSFLTYKDSTFLSIDGNIYDPEVIWTNMNVYSPAYDRMERYLKISDNHLEWDIKNGEELKISENIYNYIICAWESDNNMLKSNNYKLEKMERGFRIIPKQLKPESKTIIKYKYRLVEGRHVDNMWACIKLLDEKGDFCIAELVDEYQSDLKPDGFGGRMIKGRFDENSNEFWAYYFCDPTPFEKRFSSDLNRVVTANTNWDSGGRYIYESLQNRQHAPLITLTNRATFRKYHK